MSSPGEQEASISENLLQGHLDSPPPLLRPRFPPTPPPAGCSAAPTMAARVRGAPQELQGKECEFTENTQMITRGNSQPQGLRLPFQETRASKCPGGQVKPLDPGRRAPQQAPGMAQQHLPSSPWPAARTAPGGDPVQSPSAQGSFLFKV